MGEADWRSRRLLGSSTIEMYRMTKADMENEITSLKRGPADRPSRRPPLLHEPTLSNPRNANSSPMSMSAFPRHSESQSFPPPSMHSAGNAEQAIVCLRLKNIPYTTTEQQIYEFFANIQTPIESCKILRDRLNRGAGEALVRFHDPQSCQIAYENKNRQIFYGRSLDLRPMALFEYQNASLTPMLTVNDLQSPSTMNQHFQAGSMKRMPAFYERADDNRRNDKRARWEGGNNNNNNKGQFDSRLNAVVSLFFRRLRWLSSKFSPSEQRRVRPREHLDRGEQPVERATSIAHS